MVQHISAFNRARDGSWLYTFTQEWPLFAQAHQLSYTVPLLGGLGQTGVGDVALNFREQLVGTEGKISLAPRVSVLLPTGNEGRGFGSGQTGLQVNVPLSIRVASHVVTHWNLGATGIPGQHTVMNGGGSVIWELRPTFNAMLEFTWAQIETDITEMFVNPGIRWAFNFSNGLQIVPGIAVPIGIGPSNGERSLFLYLSFEHPF